MLLRAEQFNFLAERGDRFIAATAAQLECPLLSKGPEIRERYAIEVIW